MAFEQLMAEAAIKKDKKEGKKGKKEEAKEDAAGPSTTSTPHHGVPPHQSEKDAGAPA